jgi:hypothetical protein
MNLTYWAAGIAASGVLLYLVVALLRAEDL